MQRCDKCNGIMRADLVDYTKNILGNEVCIEKVEGFRCSECGYTTINPQIKDRLQVKLLEKRLELKGKQRNTSYPLLINKLKNVRESKNIPQKKIGIALGITEQRFGAIERNDNTPTVYTAFGIADALGVNNLHLLYSYGYIPMELYDKIKDMNENFEIIKNLPEARKEFEEINQRYEDLKKQIVEINQKARQRRKEAEKRAKKIRKELAVNESKIEILKAELAKNNSNKIVKEIEFLEKEIVRGLDELEAIKREERERSKNDEIEKERIKKEYQKLKKPRDEKLVKIQNLQKGKDNSPLLKQGYCIDYDNWQKLKEIYGTEYEIREMEISP